MNHSEEAPKLSKLPFVIGDLALLGAAGAIAARSANPITPLELLAITICVALGAALLVIPFLVNYARRQDVVLSDRQNQIAALARTTAESVEQISIAVAGIHTLINSIPKPKADAPPAVAPGEDPVARRLAQLDAAAKTQSEALAAREKALAAALGHATRQIEVLVAATAQATVAVPHPDEVSVDEASPAPPKAARARKAKPADTLPDLGLTSSAPEPMASAPSADGATRLLATAYIGIGHTLYLRGDGPGLSWEKGVPLQFVSIGKWLWETSAASAPFAAKLYKNDQLECVGLGPIPLAPGHQHEVNAGF